MSAPCVHCVFATLLAELCAALFINVVVNGAEERFLLPNEPSSPSEGATSDLLLGIERAVAVEVEEVPQLPHALLKFHSGVLAFFGRFLARLFVLGQACDGAFAPLHGL